MIRILNWFALDDKLWPQSSDACRLLACLCLILFLWTPRAIGLQEPPPEVVGDAPASALPLARDLSPAIQTQRCGEGVAQGCGLAACARRTSFQ
jgi:hypothetical protein